MSDWAIRIPYRDPDEPLCAKSIEELPAALEDPDDRRVCRTLLAASHKVGLKTIGEVLQGVEELPLDKRRRLLDGLRRRAGLKTASEIDSQHRYELECRAGRIKAAAETRPLRLGYSLSGAIVDLNEAEDEAARARVEAERRAADLKAREEDRAVDAEHWRAHKRALAAEVSRCTPPGVPS
jgi:hypothetical protein